MPNSHLTPPPSLESLNADDDVALFLDFDGTLVDIAPTPEGIVVPDGLNERLQQLGKRLQGRLALVSGRSIANLETHLGPLALACAGSHGIERRGADGTELGTAPTALPEELLAQIRAFARSEGFNLEDKPYGAALHYRAEPALEERGRQFAHKLAVRHGLRTKYGKCVVEIVAPGADKGSALRALMAEPAFWGSKPVFVGDDVTDEDGMAAAADFGGFGIAVGERASANARYALETPAAVQHWLQL